MDQRNLDIYGHAAIPWSRPLAELETFQASRKNTTWLATADPNGRPHLTGIGILWLDGHFYFTSGAGTRKSRNLARHDGCAISVSLPTIDLVVEGTARRVTDDATLRRVAARLSSQGWEATVAGDALTAPYNAPSAGPPPWDVYEVRAVAAYGVATEEPYGATRWRFPD